MYKNRLIKIIMVVALSLTIMALPAPVAAAAPSPPPPAPQTKTYDFYATDGHWIMADGTPLYSYGFIGGEEGTTIYPLGDDGTPLFPDGIVVRAPTPGVVDPADVSTNSTAFENAVRGHAQIPGPLIYCGTGDTVVIRLKNLGITHSTGFQLNQAGNDPHTIHLHGLDVDAANDGVPETSVAATPDYTPNPDPISGYPLNDGAGNVVVYMFTPKNPGSYFYHCHQEADIHVTMGMYGALIVYNPGDAGRFTGPAPIGATDPGTDFGWKYDKDYIMFLTDTDANQHFSEAGMDGTPFGFNNYTTAGLGPGTFNPVAYSPQYWFVNGLSFPETIHVNATFTNSAGTFYFNWADWIKAHPGYDPMIVGSTGTGGTVGYDGKKGQRILVRVINMGYETQPMHMHGFHAKVIGKDQRAWFWANNSGQAVTFTNPGGQTITMPVNSAQYPTGIGMEVNTLTIGSGEDYDLLFDFSTQAVTSTYNSGTQTRYEGPSRDQPPTTPVRSPVNNTVTSSPIIVAPEGNPYIGGPTVKGVGAILPQDDPQFGQLLATSSQIFVFHNHDDYKATNNGAYPGGMFTVLVPIR